MNSSSLGKLQCSLTPGQVWTRSQLLWLRLVIMLSEWSFTQLLDCPILYVMWIVQASGLANRTYISIFLFTFVKCWHLISVPLYCSMERCLARSVTNLVSPQSRVRVKNGHYLRLSFTSSLLGLLFLKWIKVDLQLQWTWLPVLL